MTMRRHWSKSENGLWIPDSVPGDHRFWLGQVGRKFAGKRKELGSEGAFSGVVAGVKGGGAAGFVGNNGASTYYEYGGGKIYCNYTASASGTVSYIHTKCNMSVGTKINAGLYNGTTNALISGGTEYISPAGGSPEVINIAITPVDITATTVYKLMVEYDRILAEFDGYLANTGSGTIYINGGAYTSTVVADLDNLTWALEAGGDVYIWADNSPT